IVRFLIVEFAAPDDLCERQFNVPQGKSKAHSRIAHKRSLVDPVAEVPRVAVQKYVVQHETPVHSRQDVSAPFQIVRTDGRFVGKIVADSQRAARVQKSGDIASAAADVWNYLQAPAVRRIEDIEIKSSLVAKLDSGLGLELVIPSLGVVPVPDFLRVFCLPLRPAHPEL